MLRPLYLTAVLLFTLTFLVLVFRTTSQGLYDAEDLGFANRLGMLLRRDESYSNPNLDFDKDFFHGANSVMDSMHGFLGDKCDFKGVKNIWQGFNNQFGVWTPWGGAGGYIWELALVRILWWVLIFILAIVQFAWVITGYIAIAILWIIEVCKNTNL